MKTEILRQSETDEIYIEKGKKDNLWLIQSTDRILIDKENIPELIKILQSFVEIN